MQVLRADTQVIVKLGCFVDKTDGFTPQTDITLAGDEAELLKHGVTSTVDISARTWLAVTGARGWYNLTLTTDDTDTEGLLTVVVQDDSDCLPVFATFMVVNANVYDALYAAATTDYLQVDTIQITGTGQTANDVGADVNEILLDTAVIGALGAGLTALATQASVNTIDDFLDTEVGLIKGVTDKLDTALVLDGAVYQLTANALELAPGGVGGPTLANQTKIIQILTGKWVITNNQMIMYDSDGTTPLYTFNLKQDGMGTEFNPDERTPV